MQKEPINRDGSVSSQQSAVSSPITRRRFIRNTGGTVVASSLALQGLRLNAWANPSSSVTLVTETVLGFFKTSEITDKATGTVEGGDVHQTSGAANSTIVDFTAEYDAYTTIINGKQVCKVTLTVAGGCYNGTTPNDNTPGCFEMVETTGILRLDDTLDAGRAAVAATQYSPAIPAIAAISVPETPGTPINIWTKLEIVLDLTITIENGKKPAISVGTPSTAGAVVDSSGTSYTRVYIVSAPKIYRNYIEYPSSGKYRNHYITLMCGLYVDIPKTIYLNPGAWSGSPQTRKTVIPISATYLGDRALDAYYCDDGAPHTVITKIQDDSLHTAWTTDVAQTKPWLWSHHPTSAATLTSSNKIELWEGLLC